jgi:phosphonate metabolism protein PhnN/1,5-bisphosphokinase (PRPP-forming)
MTALQANSHRLVVVVGASGAGKDSVLRGWLATLPREQRPHHARRTITRAAGDASEAHEAISEARFLAELKAGAFAFAWRAHGLHYGLRRPELDPLTQGRWVVMNGSRNHLRELRAAAPQARVIEVVAPEELRRARLSRRGRETHAHLQDRLDRSVPDPAPDLRIANDGDLSHAIAQLSRWWHQLTAPTPSP